MHVIRQRPHPCNVNLLRQQRPEPVSRTVSLESVADTHSEGTIKHWQIQLT